MLSWQSCLGYSTKSGCSATCAADTDSRCAVGPQSLPGVEGLAIATSVEFMLELQRTAIENDIEPGPSCTGGWKPWLQAVRAASQGHLPPGTSGSGDLVTQLREAMKGRLIQMEEALFIASGQRFEPESEAAAEALFLSGQLPFPSLQNGRSTKCLLF